MGRRINSGRNGDPPGQHKAEKRERQGQPEHLANQVDIRPLILERQAEIAVNQVLQPP